MKAWILVVLGLLASPVSAQVGVGAIVSYQIEVFDISVDPQATGKALWTMTVPAGAALCNLAALPAPVKLTQLNPQAVYWADAVNAGKICKLSTVLLGTLPPLTTGSTYILTVTAVDDRGTPSPRSNTSLPFNNTAPLALSGVVAR